MSKSQKEYEELKEQRKKVMEEMKTLEENETVKKYIELKKQNENLYNQQTDLYKIVKAEEYASCHHILVFSKIESDEYGIGCRNHGCIKCGLDASVLDYDIGELTFSEKLMFSHLRKNNHGVIKGIETKIACDLNLAHAIYSKIKEAHPNIDDKTAVKYFEIALDNIRNIKVNDNRKISRAKRLALNPNFKKWNESDM